MRVTIENVGKITVSDDGNVDAVNIILDKSLESRTSIKSINGGVPGVAKDPTLKVGELMSQWRAKVQKNAAGEKDG